jgi:DNA-binding transcriptional regulator YiaG
MRCPNCKKTDSFRSWEGPIKVMGVEVLGNGLRCSCGETLFNETEVERQEHAAATKIVSRGIRKGVEFKFVRKMAGLLAIDVADMFGVRPETVSRWERDEIQIPRTAAFTLGQLFEHPKLARAKLEAFAH